MQIKQEKYLSQVPRWFGQLAAKELVKQGHEVVSHARNEKRGREALEQVPGVKKVLIAHLPDMEATKKAVAAKVNALGTFYAVIHKAGVYQRNAGLARGQR